MAMMAAQPDDDLLGINRPSMIHMAVNPHDTLTAPIGPPPPEINMSGIAKDAGVPDIPTMAAPKVNGPASLPGLMARKQDHLMALQQKDDDPYGSPDNHPGFLGKVLHGLSAVTGGPGRRAYEEQGLEKGIEDIGKQESTEDLQGAQAGNQTAQAGKATEDTKEAPGKAASEENLQGAQASLIPSEIARNNAEVQGLENPWAKLPGNQPIGNVDQLNKGMTDRYQILHPGAALPSEFQLPANATKNDFDRVDKLLTAEETASGNVANQKQSQSLREAMLGIAEQNAAGKNLWSVSQPDGTNKVVSLRPGDTIPKGAVSLSGQNTQNIKSTDPAAEGSLKYANDYLHSGAFTGPGDEALQDQFFNLAKPSTGFRMNQAQIDQLHNMASWMDSWRGRAYHTMNGVWFAPHQREQIVQTMNALGSSKGMGNAAQSGASHSSPGSPPAGATGKAKGVDGKMYWVDKSGKNYGPV